MQHRFIFSLKIERWRRVNTLGYHPAFHQELKVNKTLFHGVPSIVISR